MHYVDIVPYLDAEIERLQAARNLLTSLTIAFNTAEDKAGVSARAKNGMVLPPASLLEARLPTLVAEPASIEPVMADCVPQASEQPVTVQHIRPHQPRGARKSFPRKQLTLQESALRGPVPAGPVVISPEEVRKTQAWKSSPPAPAATELQVPAWSGPSTDSRRVDAMLQRLINMGSDDDAARDTRLEPLSALRHG